MLKNCTKHGAVKHFKRLDGTYRCGKCASSWVINSRRNKKDKLIKLFGGKCIICGYKRYNGALDFHHLDPKTKKFSLSVKGLCYSWETIMLEAKKCVVLCKNCHTEAGAGLSKI